MRSSTGTSSHEKSNLKPVAQRTVRVLREVCLRMRLMSSVLSSNRSQEKVGPMAVVMAVNLLAVSMVAVNLVAVNLVAVNLVAVTMVAVSMVAM